MYIYTVDNQCDLRAYVTKTTLSSSLNTQANSHMRGSIQVRYKHVYHTILPAHHF